MRPTRAEIDLNAIRHNVRELKRCTRPGARMMAVVKADGYGHGAVPVARAALAAGADWLGVAIVEEGVALREAGLQAPILVLGWVPPEQAETLVAHDLRGACWDMDTARALGAAALAAGRTARVHLKVDTGMGRVGVEPAAAGAFGAALAAVPGLAVEGVFTHFAVADAPDAAYTREQLDRFGQAVGALAAAGARPALCHAANSAGILAHPDSHLDMVRAGIALYGLAPDAERRWHADLRPAMTLKTRIAHLKEMQPGQSVSYGRTWHAQGGEQVATLPVGYADGFRRLFTNRGQALVHGRTCPVVGRVCMDQTLILVPAGVPARVGDEVVLLGRQGDAAITADDWARGLGTINYEVVCLVGQRVPRVYVG